MGTLSVTTRYHRGGNVVSEWNYPGAKWWKFDFHTHTPASDDFRGQVEPKGWLRKFMEERIDCVAITDHNNGAWIDKLKEALQTVSAEEPDWYRPLYLFPGVEISVQGGVHLLALFDPEKGKAEIDALLGAVRYPVSNGQSGGVTQKSLAEVIDIVHDQGGIAVPAHVDKEKGLFQEFEGVTLEQVLNHPNIHAMEICDEGFVKPPIYENKKLQWTEVIGSDTHDFNDDTFGTFTWIKMDEPSIEGLKLALIDGNASVKRDMSEAPNQHSEYVIEEIIIEEIIIEEAKFMGRPEVLACRFSPSLNTIIGERGSGKSTLLEFMRLALRREQEIPEILKTENEKYFNVDGDNLLLHNSRLSMIYRKGETRYRLSWSKEADIASLESETENGWEAEDGEIQSLFPAYIYSQKQIFTLAQNPDALLNIIDKETSVRAASLEQTRNDLVHRYKQLEQRVKELHDKIAQRNELSGLLNDTSRQIKEIENSGHIETLQNYRQRRGQLAIIDDLEILWQKIVSRLREANEGIAPISFDEQVFGTQQDMLGAVIHTNNKWQAIQEQLSKLIEESQNIIDGWHKTKEATTWMGAVNLDIAKYEQLHNELEQKGIDPNKYPELLEQQTQYQRELEQINSHEEELAQLKQQKNLVLAELQQNREQLTENRELFLESVLENNQSVRIRVQPFEQNWEGVEEKIRQILQCENRFDRDLSTFQEIYQPGNINTIQNIKNRVSKIRDDIESAEDRRFATHLKENLPQESISELMCWFPQDSLEITFGDQGSQQSIQQGSPGQKTATLLAFIMSYGNEPLLLDQPEDDLDNELIYSLIVRQLRETKSRRQIIVVTHNANIVVNGDAEMVVPLEVANGQTHVSSPASIQNEDIRKRICVILEGGQQAFEQRYKRIHLENENV